jgi:putative glutamine amidotransferase
MTKKVLILDASSISGRSASFNSYAKEYIMGPLGTYFEGIGVEPVVKVASNINDADAIRAIVDDVDAILLPGGEDVHPAFYDGPWVYPGGGLHSAKGDYIQMEAVRHATRHGKRVFGICRGLQVINVALGGTLIQDFEGHKNKNYTELRDRFAITDIETIDPMLMQMGDVNCSHHQSVKDFGAGLKGTAYSVDGVVEALEHENGTIKAVQFHPEAERTFERQVPLVAEWLVS